MPTRHGQSDRTPDRITNRPTWLVSRAFAQSSALLAAGFDEHGDGLRGYHDRLLAALEQWGPASQADLGRNTGIDRSDVTAALTELETRDLVERRVDPENKRRKIVTITPAGIREVAALDSIVDQAQNRLLAPLTPAQQRELVTLLTLLTAPTD
ncbi:MarR family winged helix-turn-helix transcriptional regulator [Nocardia seriolae]|uniref:MarR family winged helix-turn-helix transcriptional regulator n=1 Tax=Nocardia seriolae TaxID=37332 RepID=UPI000519EFC5|nr:MarR family transcriptional regulator [Nocardia seriolae]MTJ63959.1 MarR family transcriptional regulator [Nocardia seriolae]MTJ70995.1 MarR family transcriptional regulator [Nocardia seriolae]MTJ88683.1 MarR family transcriptional regulator [Nocardia seriolae]MTK32665.1 MarR family transcriptional regulator [Nocardia seriolae]MTK41846.1 MarR family transcriptional regulator [Nocardia seriolae]